MIYVGTLVTHLLSLFIVMIIKELIETPTLWLKALKSTYTTEHTRTHVMYIKIQVINLTYN